MYYSKQCFEFDDDILKIKIGEVLGMIIEKDELQNFSWKQIFVIV